MAATAAQYQQVKSDVAKVVADQATLATDTGTETTDQTAFAAGLVSPVVYVNGDGTADIITPTPGVAPGYSVQTVAILA